MGRVFFPILSLAAAAIMALLLGAVAQDAGMTADVVCTAALSAAGLLFAAVAGGALLKRK